MAITVYSKKKHGNTKVSAHFRVKEFACKDGSDPVFIHLSLVYVLEKIRNYFDAPVTVNSGYRTPAHNKKIGGATYSQHMYGMAADIVVKGVEPAKVYEYAETLMPNSGGLGLYSSFVHIDVRDKRARWKE